MVEKASAQDLERYRKLMLTASVLYPAWSFVYRYCDPGTYDPLLGRLGVSALMISALVLSFLVKFFRDRIGAFFIALTWILTLHFFWIVDQNKIDANHAVGSFITVFSIAACLVSRRSLISYSAFVTVLGFWLRIRHEAPVLYVFFLGLATSLLITYLAFSDRLRLLLLERTARKELEAAVNSLRASEKELQASHQSLVGTQRQLAESQKMEAIGQLSSGIAHDFNNILSIILIHTDLLRRQYSQDSNLLGRLGVIEKSARRVANLTKKLLVFARRGHYEKKIFDLSTSLSETITLLEATFPETIIIEREFDQKPTWVEGDSSQVDQIFMNLAVNARDAMPNGGVLRFKAQNVKLLTEVETQDIRLPPGNYVRLTVSDTGLGIPEEFLSRVFDPFFTTKEVGKGTGLGLAVTYGIVRSHGGGIRVSSLVSKGTEFVIYFPGSVGPEAIVAPKPSSERASEVRAGGLTPRQYLVVDDDKMVCAGVAEAIRRQGGQVQVAYDGQEALDVFIKHPKLFDALVMDVRMPKKSGLDVIKDIRALGSEVFVVLMSGYAEDGEIVQLRQSTKNVSFLEKPFKLEEIISLLLAHHKSASLG